MTFNITERNIGRRGYFRIYDGKDISGILRYEITGTSSSIPNPLIIPCTTGKLYISVYGTVSKGYVESITGGVEIKEPQYPHETYLGTFDNYLLLNVSSNGSITFDYDYDY